MHAQELDQSEHGSRRRHWDPIVRVTHWGVVVAVIANALVLREGSTQHIWVGYGLAGLLGLRLIWGLLGTRAARFSSFPPSPARAVQHLSDIANGVHRPHRSHNPLGALMVYAIWSTLLVVIGSGIALANPAAVNGITLLRPQGAEAGASLPADADDEDGGAGEAEGGEEGGEEAGEELFEEAHEIAVNLLYILIALHLAGVLFETRRSGRQVLAAMTTGR